MTNETEILEQAKKWATAPIPLAPYWDGQTFEDFLELPFDEEYTAAQ